MEEKVIRGFENDDAEFYLSSGSHRTVEEVMFEILDRHADGISFIERNAGPSIDNNMDQRYKFVNVSYIKHILEAFTWNVI